MKAALLALAVVAAPAAHAELSVPKLMHECAPAVPLATFAPVIWRESGFNPVALNVNGFRIPHQPRNLGQAIAAAEWLSVHGYSYDAGLAQVNVANFARLGLSPRTVFDPCRNLKAGAAVLNDCFQRAAVTRGDTQRALRAAYSCYNTGNFHSGFENRYVTSVLAEATLPIPALLSPRGEAGRRPMERGSRPEQQDRKPTPPAAWFALDQGRLHGAQEPARAKGGAAWFSSTE